MTKVMLVNNKTSGFTLIETIIYIGLFSLIFTGIFASIYPIFTGAERLTKNIAIEGESAFVLAKINHSLRDTITSSQGIVTTPAVGQTANELVLNFDGNERYRFIVDNANTFCTSPLICNMLTLEENNSSNPLPLNGSRVRIENFSVTHVGPTSGEPRYLDISFTANSEPIGPVRYYLHF